MVCATKTRHENPKRHIFVMSMSVIDQPAADKMVFSSSADSNVRTADLANCIRALAMDAVEQANSGHPGMPMGMADVAAVLFTQFLKFDAQHPEWPDRDRFILSAGHGSMLLYALGYLTGYAKMTLEELRRFRQLGSHTAGHPEADPSLGIETTTGPLGQGLANAVGFALAEAMLAARFGREAVDHHTYVIAGDGCLMEGISQEALSLAGHLKLGRLIVLFDDNGISIDGKTSLSTSDDHLQRFAASGWQVDAIDGHDPAAIAAALAAARADTTRPSLIACRTTIAYGAPTKAGTSASHGSPLGKEEIQGTRDRLNWPYAPFEIPQHLLTAWRQVGAQGGAAYAAWAERLTRLAPAQRDEFVRRMQGDLPDGWQQALSDYKRQLVQDPKAIATRLASGNVLDVLVPLVPELVGGSADLTGSNNTRAKGTTPVTAADYDGNYMFWGVREHAMAAAMNGLALHGGFIPFGGTFLVFSDYCKPAIRLSALMHQRVIYVLTHDSIGLGEDGPTHQPIEHLAMLRAIPGLRVFRPADTVETLEAWTLALTDSRHPSVLALSRQNLPLLRTTHMDENRTARGAYVLSEAAGAHQVALVATGSEVALALAVQTQLQARGIGASVISFPCWSLFDAQPQSYRDSVLPDGVLKVAIEAACPLGWHRYIGRDGLMIGMDGFGASAPAPDLFRHFGFTAEAVVDKVVKRLGA
jgi:transketolase